MVKSPKKSALTRLSAISRRVATWLTNDWTEVTLPDAEIDHRSQPGPELPLETLDGWFSASDNPEQLS
jgi:hypothetical protein